jgi:superfamily I DNA and/or RNA helicase
VAAIEQQQLQPQHGQRSSGSWGLVGGVSDVGFWRNPKRFNVAITRAKALLVVVGSPRVLAADDNWRQLLRHCVARWEACT